MRSLLQTVTSAATTAAGAFPLLLPALLLLLFQRPETVGAVPVLQGRSISSGPVIASNFPDPAWIQVGSTYYAFSTGAQGANTPVATSTDFETWTILEDAGKTHDALPKVGAWSTGNAVWAPSVVALDDGSFVLYYAAEAQELGPGNKRYHCVGAATSQSVEGPYTPLADALSCPLSQGGAIDPAGFTDYDGKRYVTYKVDGNSIGHGGNCNNGVAPIVPTPIMLQEVSATDGHTLVGEASEILDRGDADGPLVEAPSLTRVADASAEGGWLYILFFSSNCYSGGLYDVSYAVSTNGIFNGGSNYAKAAKPLLVTGSDGGKLYSPGGMGTGIVSDKVVFHADLGQTADTRQMWAGTITVNTDDKTVSI